MYVFYLLRPRRPAYRFRIPVKRRRSRPLAALDGIDGHVYEEGYNSDPEGMIDEFIEEVCLCGHGEERVFSYIYALCCVSWCGCVCSVWQCICSMYARSPWCVQWTWVGVLYIPHGVCSGRGWACCTYMLNCPCICVRRYICVCVVCLKTKPFHRHALYKPSIGSPTSTGSLCVPVTVASLHLPGNQHCTTCEASCIAVMHLQGNCLSVNPTNCC